MRCLVLGAGVVGEAVAWDLTHAPPTASVTVADRDARALARLASRLPVTTVTADAADPVAMAGLASDYDVVVGALPSGLAFGVMGALCDAGARYCDVSFMPEDAYALQARAIAGAAVVVHDCGVAPGLSHVLVGHAAAALTTIDTVRIDVGGLPETPTPPFFYKAPFAPADVIEEYTRPARVVRGGRPAIVEALSGHEVLTVDGVGDLDSFLTDGLRSLVRTVQAADMEERTLRHAGHLPVVRALRDAGFFSTTPLTCGAHDIIPREVTARLLFPQWTYAPDERDVTVLRVDVTGADHDARSHHARWLLIDRPTTATGSLSSMARTTGFPAAIVARWLAEGALTTPGVHAPEGLGLRGLAPRLLDALRQRGVSVVATAAAASPRR